MPPLSTLEVLTALAGGAVTRAFCVGGAVWAAMAIWGVDVWPQHLWAILWFGFLGSLFLALMGVLTSIWAEKFDHAAAVTNFVVAPLACFRAPFIRSSGWRRPSRRSATPIRSSTSSRASASASSAWPIRRS
jgi:ABC-2 type transport system permease protein